MVMLTVVYESQVDLNGGLDVNRIVRGEVQVNLQLRCILIVL